MERELTRDLSSLEQVTTMLEEFSQEHSISEADRFSLALALEEIITNIIRHQPKNDAAIRVRMNGEPDRVVVTIEDPNSVFFDPTAAQDPNVELPIEKRRPGGLGIFLTKRVMDDVRYEYQAGQGTTTLVKRLEH